MPEASLLDYSREELLALGRRDLSALVGVAAGLQAQVRRLLDAAAQNSANSSKPPSSDRQQPDKPKPQSLRSKSGRKPGGQPGHPGRTLELCQSPDRTEQYPLEQCPCCGDNLSRQPVKGYERRQVFDTPEPKLECEEHRAEKKDCPRCHKTVTAAFPSGVNAPVQYGPRIRALSAYLYDAQAGASQRVSQACQELFGHAISEATIQQARQQLYENLQPFEEALVKLLPQQEVLHPDETSVPINKTNHWLHVLCTPLLTFFSLQPARGKEALLSMGILCHFTGWLMHDFLSSYLSLSDCLHTFCKSHLMRELVFIFEQHRQVWAKNLCDLFREMLQAVRERKARDAPFTQKELDQWHDRYWKILKAGRRKNPLPSELKNQKRRKQSKEQNLLDRLEGYDHCILAFLENFDLPFTNNEAERAFRFIKTRIKISGCFRTLSGAKRHVRIYSYISTLRKQKLNVLSHLQSALEGRPFLPQI